MSEAASGERPTELVRRLDDDGIAHLWVAYTDYNGRTQAKSVPRERCAAAISRGISFARANLDFNLLDHLAPDGVFTAETGDFFAVADPATYAPWPLQPSTGRVLAWMRQEDGAVWEGCPRTMLMRQVEALADLGLRAEVAFEPEGYLFRRDEQGNPVPADRSGMFTLAGLATQADVLHRVSETLTAAGIGVEQVATEYGPGQFEINIRHAPPLKAADDLVTLKDVVRSLASRAGLIASFMPKPREDLAGCGLHVHLSLWERDGSDSAMEDPNHQTGLSEVGRAFIAGILAHAPALVGVGAPTVNSYKRLQPGSWAPAHAAYGIGNRSALVRIPGGARRRIEVRAGDNTSSPYLYLGALLAAGRDGIERQLDPGGPATADLGQLSASEAAVRRAAMLPRTVHEALAAVEDDPLVGAALGPVIFPEWLKVKRSEVADFDLTVSDWERRVYLQS